mmetsp:Transcript_19740/g.37424  ORF Transcript_19740/g.37424 Transcript_19740/m.37424 type:complete len:170 (-) Transcript_19740:61-570(-)
MGNEDSLQRKNSLSLVHSYIQGDFRSIGAGIRVRTKVAQIVSHGDTTRRAFGAADQFQRLVVPMACIFAVVAISLFGIIPSPIVAFETRLNLIDPGLVGDPTALSLGMELSSLPQVDVITEEVPVTVRSIEVVRDAITTWKSPFPSAKIFRAFFTQTVPFVWLEDFYCR